MTKVATSWKGLRFEFGWKPQTLGRSPDRRAVRCRLSTDSEWIDSPDQKPRDGDVCPDIAGLKQGEGIEPYQPEFFGKIADLPLVK